MSSISSIGVSGLQRAESRFEASASRIVEGAAQQPDAATPEFDLAVEMVSLSIASYDFKASAKVVQVGRDMSRTLLDILA